jgi:hypothetical protein
MKDSQAITLREFLSYLISKNKRLSPSSKIKIAFSILKTTHAKFTNDKKLIEFFDVKGYKDIINKKDEINDYLVELSQLDQLDVIIELMDNAPEILVQYPSSIRGSLVQQATRMNINRAYHINLIEIFGMNSPAIAELAKKMDAGFYFRDKFELLAFAATINKEARIRKLLEDAIIGNGIAEENTKRYFDLNIINRRDLIYNSSTKKKDIAKYNKLLHRLRKEETFNKGKSD